MRLLTRRSIRTKLSLLAGFAAFAAVLLTGLGFAGLCFQQQCTSEVNQLRHRGELLSHYGAPIFTLRNRAAGDRLLAALGDDASIEAACLFDVDQKPISHSGTAKAMAFPSHLQGKPYRLSSFNRLEILSPVEVAGQQIGFIYLQSNTKAAQAQLMQFARHAGLIALGAFGLSYLLTFPLRRVVSRPILQLAKATEGLVDGGGSPAPLANDFSPECARVIDAVNGLVAKIKDSAQLAQRATTELESRVAESNHGLVQELKRLQKRQQELERARNAATAASVAKSSFIVDMSREIRGPLDDMVTGLQTTLCNTPSLSGPAAEQLNSIYQLGQRLQSLIQDVAETATIEAGRLECDQIDCCPHMIIAKVVDALQVEAGEKELSLEYIWRGREEESLTCDPERLSQVAQVLIENAIRHTEIGGVRVSARFEQGLEARQLRLEVTDTGIGISAGAMDHIFEPPEQPSRVRNRDGETVIGLHNCRKIVTAMDGQITVSSSVGEGSAFTVTINAEHTPSDQWSGAPETRGGSSSTPDLATASSSSRVAAGAPAIGKDAAPRILVVDDSDTNRDLTQLVLRRAGARVEGAENGLEAVQAAIRESFDLILMDMQMPVMDGYSATRELRAQGIDVPIIALTAYAMNFDEQKCRAAGCNGHLTKPIEAEDLLRAAQQVLPSRLKLACGVPKNAKAMKPTATTSPSGEVRPRSPYDFDLEPQTNA